MDPNYQHGMYYSPDMMAYGGYVPDPMLLAQQAIDYHALQQYSYSQLAGFHDPNLAMMGADDGSGAYGAHQSPAQRKNFLQVKNVEDATAQQMQEFLLELLGTTDASIFQGFYKHEASWFAAFHDDNVAHVAMQTIRTHYVGENKLFVKLFTFRQLPKQVARQAAHGKGAMQQGGGGQQSGSHGGHNQNNAQQGGGGHHGGSAHQSTHQQHHGYGGGHGGYGHGEGHNAQHSSSHHSHSHPQHGQHSARGPRGHHQAAAAATAAAAAQQAAAQAAGGPAAAAAVAITPDADAGIWNRTGTSGRGSPPKFRRTQPRGPTPGAPPGATTNPLSPQSGSTAVTDGTTEAGITEGTPMSGGDSAWEATERGKFKDAAKFAALLPVVQIPGPTAEVKAFAIGRGKPVVAAAEGRITPTGVLVQPLAR